MSKAFKCDRCGVLYEPYEKPVLSTLYVYKTPYQEPKDLCKSCQEDLKAFMENKPLTGDEAIARFLKENK